MSEGAVQLPPDSTGKRVDLVPVTIAAGTTVVDADGVQSTLAADLTYFRQVAVIGDPESPGSVASVHGERGLGAILADNAAFGLLSSIDQTLRSIETILRMATT